MAIDFSEFSYNKKKIADLKCRHNDDGCIAFIRTMGDLFFAVNGVPDDIYNIVYAKEILGSDSIFCSYLNRLATYDPLVVDGNLKKDADDMYDHLSENKCELKDYPFPVTINTVRLPSYKSDRLWSCAEKKIVAYLMGVTPPFWRTYRYRLLCIPFHFAPIYTTRRPCFHCLPVLNEAIYLTGGYKINKICTKRLCNTKFCIKTVQLS